MKKEVEGKVLEVAGIGISHCKKLQIQYFVFIDFVELYCVYNRSLVDIFFIEIGLFTGQKIRSQAFHWHLV